MQRFISNPMKNWLWPMIIQCRNTRLASTRKKANKPEVSTKQIYLFSTITLDRLTAAIIIETSWLDNGSYSRKMKPSRDRFKNGRWLRCANRISRAEKVSQYRPFC
jgi:hypothetical protein